MAKVSQQTSTIDLVNKSLKKRYRAEKRFQAYGIAAILFGLACLVVLFTDIVSKGSTAFFQHSMYLEVTFDADRLGIYDINDEQQLATADYQGIIRAALREKFPDAKGRRDRRALYSLVSNGEGFRLRTALEAEPSLLGQTRGFWLIADDDVDTYIKSRSADGSEAFTGRLSEKQIGWV